MTKGGININITGGNANIGNVSQGDHNTNTVHSQSINTHMDKAFADFLVGLEHASQPKEELQALRDEIMALKAKIEAKAPAGKTESLIETAHELYDKYGWAGGLLKKLFAVLVPGWLLS